MIARWLKHPWIVLILLGLIEAQAKAQRSPESGHDGQPSRTSRIPKKKSTAWRKGKRAEALQRAIEKKCPVKKEAGASPEEEEEELILYDGPGASFKARQIGTIHESEYSWWGSGVDSESGTRYTRTDLSTCRTTRLTLSAGDGGFRESVVFEFPHNGLMTDEEVRALLALDGAEPGDPQAAKHGGARLLASIGYCVNRPDRRARPQKAWQLLGPLYAPQPEFRGVPPASPRTYWSEKLASKIALKPPTRSKTKPKTPVEETEDDQSAFSGDQIVSKIDKPKATYPHGLFTLYESELWGRNSGQIVAAYHTQTNTHRWLLESRACISGKIEWLGGNESILVGIARPTHPAYREERGFTLFIVNLVSGFVYEIDLPRPKDNGEFEARVQGEAIDVALSDRSKMRIPFAEIAQRLKKN